MSTILGLDPSVNSSGFAVVEETTVHLLGTINPDKKMNEQEKLDYIYKEIMMLCRRTAPSIAVIEDQFVGMNPQVSLYLARVRGVCMLACQHSGVPVRLFTPSEIKKSMTGKGNAKKELVQEKAVEAYKHNANVQEIFKDGVKKSGKKKNDDMSDALAAVYTLQALPIDKPA